MPPLDDVLGPPADDAGHDEDRHAPRAPRPLHLLPTPAPIEAMAPVPDRPPVMFRWRGRHYRIVRAEGPERIGPEWWRTAPETPGREDGETRDYFRVEAEDGQRFWVFRQGLYRPDAAPRWYLHGFFP